MKTIINNGWVEFKMNPNLEKYLLDPEFLQLLSMANLPITVTGDLVSIHEKVFPGVQNYYRHFHGRSL